MSGSRKTKTPGSTRRGGRSRGKTSWRVPWRALSLTALSLAVCLTSGLYGATLYFDATTPDIQSVEHYRTTALQTSRVFARNGAVIGEFYRERRTLVRGEDIPSHVKLAAVAAEDGDFYRHDGIDPLGIVRAVWVNVRDRRFSQGASTITQQVARTFYLSQEKTLARKLREAFLARKLERHLTKDEILELYLNQIYFGHGRYGLAEAARYYLGTEVGGLTVDQAALLMAAVPAPARLNPMDAPDRARVRRDRIISRLQERGALTARQSFEAKAQPIRVRRRSGDDLGPYAWFVDAVRRRVERVTGRQALQEGGLRIYTTLDPPTQHGAIDALKEQLGDNDLAPQAASVLMRASDREVLSLVGGGDFKRSQYNRAIQARRQAGSTFKPLVYGSALEAGIVEPETTYPNKRIKYRGGREAWSPRNSDGVHDGADTTIGEALRRSINVIAVQVLRDTGIPRLTDFCRRVGVTSPIPADLTAALGSAEVGVMEITNAYATIANGGFAGDPVLIRRVEAPDGAILYTETSDPHRVLSEELAATLSRMLVLVVEEGTGQRARIEDATVAGKTGTTNGRRDAWFVGYTVPEEERHSQIVGGVWVGHDDHSPLEGTGGSLAAPLWRASVSRCLERYATRREDTAAARPRVP